MTAVVFFLVILCVFVGVPPQFNVLALICVLVCVAVMLTVSCKLHFLIPHLTGSATHKFLPVRNRSFTLVSTAFPTCCVLLSSLCIFTHSLFDLGLTQSYKTAVLVSSVLRMRCF